MIISNSNLSLNYYFFNLNAKHMLTVCLKTTCFVGITTYHMPFPLSPQIGCIFLYIYKSLAFSCISTNHLNFLV